MLSDCEALNFLCSVQISFQSAMDSNPERRVSKKRAIRKLEECVENAMSTEQLCEVDSSLLGARALRFCLRLPNVTCVDDSYPGIRSRFYRTNGWSYGFYVEDELVPSKRSDTYRILPNPWRSSVMPGSLGKCVHHAVVACIEARLRLRNARLGGSRVPNLSVQQVVNAVPGNTIFDVFEWIWEFGLVSEKNCPFTAGQMAPYNDDEQKGKRYNIGGYDVIDLEESKVGSLVVWNELVNNGPVVATYANRVLTRRKSCIRDKGDIVVVELKNKDGDLVERPFRHCVVVTGVVIYKDRNFFAVLNSVGPEWGNRGMGLLDCKLVETIGIPHVELDQA